MTASERLAELVCSLAYNNLPPEVVEKAKTCLLHGIGTGLAGIHVQFGHLAAKLAESVYPGNQSTLLLNGNRTSVTGAAFANSVLLHSRAQEDTHGTTHCGTAVIPVVLALGEQNRCSGEDVLCALVAGYEVAIATGKDHTSESTARGFRASSIYGIIGAAAAAAKLLGLTKEQTVNALGFAASFAGGTTQAFIAGTTEWRYEVGMAAVGGITAAYLAQQGGKAARDALDGAAGYYYAFTGTTDKTASVGADLGRNWEIMNVDIKPYSVCAFNQTPVATMIGLVEREDLKPGEIASVEIEMSEYEANYPGMAATGPFATIGGTLMSTPFCLALCVRNRAITLEGLHCYDDATIREILTKTIVRGNAERPRLSCKITVETTDGSTLIGETKEIGTEYRFNWETEVQLIKSMQTEMNREVSQLDRLINNITKLHEITDVSLILVDLFTSNPNNG